MNIFEEIRHLATVTCPEPLAAAREEGRPVIGYFGTYVPVELIDAAGAVPYQMRAVGSTGTEYGDRYYSPLNCTFVRHCFDKVLRGDFAFLGGVVFSNGCDHTRRFYDNWRYCDTPPAFAHMFPIPHVTGEHALVRYTEECRRLRSVLEEKLGVTITDGALADSIARYNRLRTLIRQIYDLRAGEVVPIKGSEFVALTMAVTAIPVNDAIDLCERLLAELPGRDVRRPGEVRILLASGHMEDIEHVELLEDSGALIAADMLCQGLRGFDGLVDEDDPDPCHAFAVRAMTHLSCPRMLDDYRGRLDCLADLMERHHIQGVIIDRLKFCDIWGGEAFIWKCEGRRQGFPFIKLERELYGGSQGQIMTRAQAFYEQIKNGDDLKKVYSA